MGPAGTDRGASRLERDLSVDVCVVGAGIAGITTAYLAAAAGYEVAVLDSSGVDAGQTQLSSAHLATALDDR